METIETLESIKVKMTQTASDVKQILDLACTPSRVKLARDPDYGIVGFQLSIKLDEFDPDVIADNLDRIRQLLEIFKNQRTVEKELRNKQLLKQAITPFIG